MKANLLPKHGGEIVNMVEGFLGKYRVFHVNFIRRSLVEMHATLCELSYYEHNHVACHICSRNPQGCVVVKSDLQEMLDQNLIQITRDRDKYEHEMNVIVPHFNIPEPVVIAYNSQKSVLFPLVIRLEGLKPYEYDKVTMIRGGKEVPILSLSSVVNIAYVSGVTQCGRVFTHVAPKRIEDASVGKQAQVETLVM